MFLGIGLGGFNDGILLPMLLQRHHLICFTRHPDATLSDLLGFLGVSAGLMVVGGLLMRLRPAARAAAPLPADRVG